MHDLVLGTLRMRGCIGSSGGALPQVSDRDGEWQAARTMEGHQGGSPPYKNAVDIMNAYISARSRAEVQMCLLFMHDIESRSHGFLQVDYASRRGCGRRRWLLDMDGGLEMSKRHYLYGRLHDTLDSTSRELSVAPNIIPQFAQGHRRLVRGEVAGAIRA